MLDLNFLIENWRIVAIVAAILGYFGFDKAKVITKLIAKKIDVTKVLNPSQLSTDKSVETGDFEAINHLRDRAVLLKDKDLLKEVKDISCKFFDIHSIID